VPPLPQAVVFIVNPVVNQLVKSEEEIFADGWLYEEGTTTGIEGVELILRLESIDGELLGSEAYIVTEKDGSFATIFIMPDEVESCEEYRFRIYSNETTYVDSDEVILRTGQCTSQSGINLWLILLTIIIFVLFAILLVLISFRKKRGGNQEHEVPGQKVDEVQLTESDDVET
ncbi:MAG: hypothetical protein KAW09_02375, partial [Thermoplasmata archaeon]|nr:hypothetical protein [Thermoplasmata archaeon]